MRVVWYEVCVSQSESTKVCTRRHMTTHKTEISFTRLMDKNATKTTKNMSVPLRVETSESGLLRVTICCAGIMAPQWTAMSHLELVLCLLQLFLDSCRGLDLLV